MRLRHAVTPRRHAAADIFARRELCYARHARCYAAALLLLSFSPVMIIMPGCRRLMLPPQVRIRHAMPAPPLRRRCSFDAYAATPAPLPPFFAFAMLLLRAHM